MWGDGLQLFWLCTLIAPNVLADVAARDADVAYVRMRRVLVLGGTQFMGRLLVERLLDTSIEGHGVHFEVTLMNRGVTYNPFSDDQRVRHLRCDRIHGREECVSNLQSIPWIWDAVVDFTAFHPLQIQDLRIGLTRLNVTTGLQFLAVRQYVYISTDSVYMSTATPKHDGFMKETDDVAPDASYVSFLKSKNEYQYNYGNLKRQCEVSLQGRGDDPPFPYTVLRLPDVFGPYDNQGAWPELQHLLIHSEQGVPAGIASNLMRQRPEASPHWQQLHARVDANNFTFSIVYAPDVAEAIMQILRKGFNGVREIFNVADDEPVSLLALLQTIGAALSIRQINIDFVSKSLLPSTDFGPINASKFMTAYPEWRPTRRRSWAMYLVEWYKDPLHMSYHRDVRSAGKSTSSSERSKSPVKTLPKKNRRRNKRGKSSNKKSQRSSTRLRKKQKLEL